MRKFWFLKMIFIGAVAIAAFSYVFMLLWNWLVPDLFHGPLLSFPQALGLLILSKILFKGFGCKGNHWRHHNWRERMQEKMNGMTPEEREKFRAQWKQRCVRWGRWEEGKGESEKVGE